MLEDRLRKSVEIAKKERSDRILLEQQIEELKQTGSSSQQNHQELEKLKQEVMNLQLQLKLSKHQLSEAEGHAKEAESKCERIQEKLNMAEERASRVEFMALEQAVTGESQPVIEDFSSAPPPPPMGGPPAPPPPPPMGAPAEPFKLKITKSPSEAQAPPPAQKVPDPSFDVINQIRQGVHLKKTERVEKSNCFFFCFPFIFFIFCYFFLNV